MAMPKGSLLHCRFRASHHATKGAGSRSRGLAAHGTGLQGGLVYLAHRWGHRGRFFLSIKESPIKPLLGSRGFRF